jgi:putative ABC transport system permease protein
MRAMRRLLARAANLFRRNRGERDFADEIESHLQLHTDENRRLGMTAADARRDALIRLGGVEQVKELHRDARTFRWIDDARRDVGYAIRMLRRSPAFTAVALLSLSLGIGANTAIFSLIDAVLLKELPVERPDRLFFIDNTGGRSGGSNAPPYPCFEILRDHNRFFSAMAAFTGGPSKITIDGGAPERVRGLNASGNYFDLLGVRAVAGRLLTPADDTVFDSGGPDGAVAVISYGYWQRRFGLDPAVMGKRILVGARPVTIVGVTEPRFLGLDVGTPIDITLPMMLAGENVRSRTTWWMSAIGRLKPDASVEQARADIEALWDPYMTGVGMTRDKRRGFSGIVLVPALRGSNGLRRAYGEPLWIVMGIVAVVLLIGCANVANLLLARASARRGEIAVRLAIGAGRARIVRQLLTEGVVLAVLGSAVGVFVARWAASFIAGMFRQGDGGVVLNPEFDLRVLAFTAAIAVVTAVLFSLAPALHATRVDAAKPIASPGSRVRLGQLLVIAQVALSATLLCAAVLFLRTLHNLNTIDAGFNREGVLTTVVESTVPGRNVPPKTPEERRRDHTRLAAMWSDLEARLAALPDVKSAAISTMIPVSRRDRGVNVAVESGGISGAPESTHLNHVTPGYLSTMGIRLVAGRAFTPADRAASLRVAILNETSARALFGTQNPIGRRINFPRQRIEDFYEIVGIVSDTRYRSLRTPDERMVYLPLEQAIDPVTQAAVSLRGPRDVLSLASAVRAAVAEAIPGGFAPRIGTMEERVRESLLSERLLSMLAGFFGGLALLLACIGLYGVMAYSVVRRTREIGIRMAIGARARTVVWMVTRETLALVLLGASCGSVAAVLVSRYVNSQLFGVTPGDPLSTTAAVLSLLGVAVAAGFLPARRASRIDPVRALRTE